MSADVRHYKLDYIQNSRHMKNAAECASKRRALIASEQFFCTLRISSARFPPKVSPQLSVNKNVVTNIDGCLFFRRQEFWWEEVEPSRAHRQRRPPANCITFESGGDGGGAICHCLTRRLSTPEKR